MSQVVEVALNGDAASVDSALRRTMYAMAHEYDDHNAQIDARLETMQENITSEVQSVRRLLLGLTGTVVTAIIAAVVNILLAF